MRLHEIAQNPTTSGDQSDLRTALASPGVVKITNASYDSTGPSLGTLQDLGAGKIARENPPYKGKWFGFNYFTKFPDGTPILAKIDLGHGQVLEPGGSFMDDY